MRTDRECNQDETIENSHSNGLWDEIKSLAGVSRAALKFVPFRDQVTLLGASLIVAVCSSANIMVAILLGVLVDRVGKETQSEQGAPFLHDVGNIFLWLAIIYLIREGLNILRRTLVESSCTRLNRDLQQQLIAHVMKLDLQQLASVQIGSLQMKIFEASMV